MGKKSYYNIIEVLTFICCCDEGHFKILLKKKKTDPYKGKWILPGNILSNEETFETCAKNTTYETTGIIPKKMMQNYVFSDLNRDADERIIASVYTVSIIKNLAHLNEEYEVAWFDIDNLPVMGYDHKKIITEVFNTLRKKIIYNVDNVLKEFFPYDFTLTELQKFWEYIIKEKTDRRNFRKKLISQGFVAQTGEEDKTKVGRPSKLYCFTDKLKEGSLN